MSHGESLNSDDLLQKTKIHEKLNLSRQIVVSIISLFCIVFSVVNCSVLSVGRFVKASPDGCLSSQMKFNTTCSFSCPQGYQLQGPSYKQCGANGQWTDSSKPDSCLGELKITGVAKKTRDLIFSWKRLVCKVNSSLRLTANNFSDGFF